MSGVASLRHQARLTREVVRRNLEGISHEESLIQPRPAGNCLNWVLGHLVSIYNQLLPLLERPQVLPGGTLALYARGSSPITRPSEAMPLQDLVRAWNEAAARVDAGLAELPAERLIERVPESPTGDPDETVGSLLLTVLFHQAYHAGQLGILRRIAGKPGAIT
jgi:uncharacterized damage-inducible protein DinB